MPQSYPLQVSASTTLDGSGEGQAQLGPQRVREHWQPAAVYVEASSFVLDAQAELYIGVQPNPASQFSQTGTGSSGDTCAMGGIDIQTGQYLTVQWHGGDPGAVATMTVTGRYTIGAPE